MTSEQARLNARNAGRPKGSLTREQKLKHKVAAQVNFRIAKMADKLLNAQVITALGTHRMITIEIDPETKEKHVTTIRDETRMQNLLDNGVYGQDYLIVEGAKADWKAANAMLDRAFGKAAESLKVDMDVKFSLKGLAERRAMIDGNEDAKIIDLPNE